MTVLDLGAGDSAPGPTVVCLGFFDGVHRGHAQLVKRAAQIARQQGVLACVHTFSRMPARVLQPQRDILELTPLAEKQALLASMGVEVLAVSPFDEATRTMSARRFFDEILVDRLHARHIVAGFHHHFGARGEGDTDTLRALCRAAEVNLDVVPPVTLEDGELISSTAIRNAIREGDFDKASRMLGREWKSG